MSPGPDRRSRPPLSGAADVTDHDLPGIGHRYELHTTDGTEAVVVIHHSGRRDLYVKESGRKRPQAALTLTDTQARTLGAILGGAYFKPAVVEDIEAAIGDLLIDWITLDAGSAAVGRSIADLEIRRKTGMTVAAIVRRPHPVTAPEPTELLVAGDQIVVIGRQEDLPRLLRLLADGPGEGPGGGPAPDPGTATESPDG
jgi:TrkA domain protein